MTTSVDRFVTSWLFDPTVGKLVSTTVAFLIVMALVRISRRVLSDRDGSPRAGRC